MSFTYENQGTNTYLVYCVQENDVVDTMSLGMLTNNKIDGLIQTVYTQMDEKKLIKYNVSSKVSVKQFFSGPVNKKRLVGVFSGIVNAMIASEEYMIDPNCILLDMDYIFTDVSTCETNLVCLPIVNERADSVNLGAMFKNIVFNTQFDQTESCDYVAKLINYLNSSPVFNLEEFRAILDEIAGKRLAASALPQGNEVQPVSPPRTDMSNDPQKTPVMAQPAKTNMGYPQSAPVPAVNSSAPAVPGSAVGAGAMPPAPAVQPQIPTKNGNIPFAVPQESRQTAANAYPAAVQPQNSAAEKQMSMMHLLMHYSKENKELYKQQKAQKKANAAKGSNAAPVPAALPTAPSPAPQMPAPQTPVMPLPAAAAAPAPLPAAPMPAPVSAPTPVPAPVENANFGETTVLSAANNIGETTVLGQTSASVEVKPILYRIKNNERIIIDKPVFRIGKEKSYVDYFIGDNTAVSRSHANIVSRGGEYFIVDTNSTNHTYVNGNMIPSNVETKILQGTRIQLANEEFEFKII